MSLARALYAFNSTNAEGWGLYSEYIMQPYEPTEGQLLTLQLRLLRAARAFLDPELQSGAVTPARAYEVLEKDVVLSHAFAKEEVERFTYRSPGQANSYFYGYTRLLALRKETEAQAWAQVRPEEVPRLHSESGPAAPGPDAQGGAGGVRRRSEVAPAPLCRRGVDYCGGRAAGTMSVFCAATMSHRSCVFVITKVGMALRAGTLSPAGVVWPVSSQAHRATATSGFRNRTDNSSIRS